MLFNSYDFLVVFLPIGLLIFACSTRVRWADAPIWVLLALSVAFYARHLGAFWYVMFLSILANFAIGRAIATNLQSDRRRRAKLILTAGVIGDLVLLGAFKYAYWLSASLGLIPIMSAPVALPLGISFYTFTQIAYLVDLYGGKARTETLNRYALFVTYFPHLIAGPIIHHKDVMVQFSRLRDDHVRSPRTVFQSLALFSIGLFKKCVIADSLAPLVASAFDTRDSVSSFGDCWLGLLAYAMQIYFDFSAYSDMALGVSLLFGIRLPINFWSPYRSMSIIDFWRRWHISLSSFLRDYVYIPLGGNRSGPSRRYLNIFLTMLVGGIWHGAGATFVIWGALHGAFILSNHAWRATPLARSLARSLARRTGPSRAALEGLSWLGTFLAVCFAWIFFRSTDLAVAARMLSGLSHPAAPWGTPRLWDWFLVAGACAIAWGAPNAYEILDWRREAQPERGSALIDRLRGSLAFPVAFGAMLGVAILFVQRQSAFLYWQF